MRKITAMILVVSIVAINCETIESSRSWARFTPDVKSGAYLYVQLWDGSRVEGELITVKKTSLLLKDSDSWLDVNIEIGNVESIKVFKSSKALKMAGIGFLTGAGVGALMGFSGGDDNSGIISFTAGQKALIFGIFLGVIFGLLGAISGATQGIDQKIRFDGKSDSEIQKILEELSKRARIT